PDSVVLIDGDTPRILKLAFAVAEAAPGIEELAVAGELLNPVVCEVGDQHVAVPIDHDRVRELQLSRFGPELSPVSPDASIRSCPDYAVQPGVQHKQVPFVVQRNTKRSIQNRRLRGATLICRRGAAHLPNRAAVR